jgi:hypothetical protein
MKKISRLSLLLPAMLVVCCNKDQKTVNELEGTWYVGSYTRNNNPALPAGSTLSFNFTRCKVKKGDCDGSVTFGTTTLPLTYRIADNGTSYTITSLVPGIISTQNGTITEHSKSRMVFTSSESGDIYVTTLHR